IKWTAPERRIKKRRKEVVDVWAFGV
nr:tyrosine kinase {catalytic domain, clone Xbtk19, subdomain VIII} [Xenopus borealis, Peptide Partial, 25 aa] [Xenopus borealis]